MRAFCRSGLEIGCWLAISAASGCGGKSPEPAVAAAGAASAGAQGQAASGVGAAAVGGGGGAPLRAGSGAAGVVGAGASAAGAGAPAPGSGGTGVGAGTGAPAAGSGGSSGAGGGGASAAGGGPAAPPLLRDGKYLLEVGAISLEVDPQQGARITRFALAGQNLLTGPEVDSGNWGSTFWPSPQQRWNWPPVPELDNLPYSASLTADSLELSSQPGVRAKVSVKKRFRVNAAAQAIDIEYTLRNDDSVAVSWAPWEISRVAPQGLSFFPSGEKSVNSELPALNMTGYTWYQHDPTKLSSMGQKLSADGSKGWLAHVAGDVLFVKKFMDVPLAQQAPAPEAEIEIYAAPSYVELEPQGPYSELAPGAEVRWQVRWYALKLPAAVTASAGNPALTSLVEDLVAKP
jgi:hypothetical protein